MTIHRLRSRIDTLVAALCAQRGAACLVAALSLAAHAQTRIEALGTLDGGYSRAFVVSSDGNTVVGGSDFRAYRWTPVSGMVGLETPGFSVSNGISADGSVVVGQANFPSAQAHAFRWTQTELKDLGTLGGFLSTAFGASADGSTVVGFSLDSSPTQRAFRWTEAEGMIALDNTPDTSSSATGISASGGEIVGTIGDATVSSAFRRTSGGAFQDIGTLPGDDFAVPNSISANGAVVVGTSHNSANTNRAFRWTSSSGMQNLLTLPGGGDSFAYGTNETGAIVVGRADAAPNDSRAFRWSSAGGMLDLNALLPRHGLNLSGWILREARGVSADGNTMVGFGDHLGRVEAWRIVLCLSDFNGDGLVNDQDAQIFIAAYNILDCADPEMPAGCPVDLDSDGIVNDKDFEIFIVAYDTLLCP